MYLDYNSFVSILLVQTMGEVVDKDLIMNEGNRDKWVYVHVCKIQKHEYISRSALERHTFVAEYTVAWAVTEMLVADERFTIIPPLRLII